jgi:type III secretory pathway component EscU
VDESELDLSLDLLSSELSSAAFFFALLEVADELLTTLLLALAPFTVWVVLLTTTLVAPSAKTIDTIANGEINGGVR